jgi:hypothetical protein
LFPFFGRERVNGRLYFLNGAHDSKLCPKRKASKLAFKTKSNGSPDSPHIANRKSKLQNP